METTEVKKYDVIVVGAGFSGMYLLHKFRRMGMKVKIFEAGSDVGGTWFWNRYPGARCDVESMDYSYSFDDDLQQEWNWPEKYSAQPDILAYAQHCADRFDLRKDIQFNTKVESAYFHEDSNTWEVRTEKGDVEVANFCIMATGCLSASRVPEFKGLDSFKGKWYHTGRWPHEGVDFSGKRVAVIGTGSSGIQAIPMIAKEAQHLTVFQRTPSYSLPAQNGPMDLEHALNVKKNYNTLREEARNSATGYTVTAGTSPSGHTANDVEKEGVYQTCWNNGGIRLLGAFNDILLDKNVNETAAEFVRNKIKSIVKDPEVAKVLTPTDYPIGSKRICVDTGYYDTFNRPNVTLVDIKKKAIEEITEKGVKVGEKGYEFDAIVFATGFDAMTGALAAIDIRGLKGLKLLEKWEAGPRSFLGLMSAQFPNMFIVTGPGSPSVLSNVLLSIEQHVEWITDCIGYLRANNKKRIDVVTEEEDKWVEHVNEVAGKTLYMNSNSWYLGANVPGKPRVFMPYVGGVHNYRRKCNEVAASGYSGFILA